MVAVGAVLRLCETGGAGHDRQSQRQAGDAMKIARRAALMMVAFVLSGTPGAGAQMGMGGRTPQI